MIIVYSGGSTTGTTGGVFLRPTPLISISNSPIRNKEGKFGSTYDITLNGTIIAYEGSPYSGGNWATSSARPDGQSVSDTGRLSSILEKQRAIRQLFARDGLALEVMDVGANEPHIIMYPILQSVSFQEGPYYDTCNYTVNLKADALYNKDNKFEYGSHIVEAPSGGKVSGIDDYSHLIEDYTDSWSLEVDDSISPNPNILRSYRVTRNISATGKSHYTPSGKRAGWEEAKRFIKNVIPFSGAFKDLCPFSTSGLLNLPDIYDGYNHSRTESVDKTAGTYSVTDSWLVTSGTAFETYTLSLSSSISEPFVKVGIDGRIKGLVSTPASGAIYTSGATSGYPIENARLLYNLISNSGNFGSGCIIFQRAANACKKQLNVQPLSISLGVNDLAGEITYNLEFNNRPVNVISGVLYENISINDTYPGDVYAVIPVIGRPTGPVLQYIGGRTEYRREASIEIGLDYTDINYGGFNRAAILLSKPSLNDPVRSYINQLIQIISPTNEPSVRKCYLEPPRETWNPKEGKYSISLSWVYELGY